MKHNISGRSGTTQTDATSPVCSISVYPLLLCSHCLFYLAKSISKPGFCPVGRSSLVHVYMAQMQQLLGFNKAPVKAHYLHLRKAGKSQFTPGACYNHGSVHPSGINSRMTEGIYTCFASVCGTKATGKEKATSP